MSSEPIETADRTELPDVGDRIRERRQSMQMSVRELARRLALSPSLISQIERGKATPSVGTLYAITTELRLSLDELFSEQGSENGAPRSRPVDAPAGLKILDEEARRDEALGRVEGPGALHTQPLGPVVAPRQRKVIQLDSGVRWERLTPSSDPNVDFLFVVYEPGGASCEDGLLMRHAGREYGHVLSGTLEVTVGFEVHVLGPGDSVSFDSTTPHRLATIGEEPVEAIWIVVGRSGDSRTA